MIDFTISDIPRIFTLAFLELLLSADNAIVLGVITNALAPHLRKKALFIGIVSAFLLRATALVVVSTLLQHTWIELLGAMYLIYLPSKYFWKKGKSTKYNAPISFWKTVVLIEFLDLVFALDSIVAGIAFIDNLKAKLWIVYVGGMLGLIGMRYAADLFSRLLDRFPKLEACAYLMVGWVGVKLGLNSFQVEMPQVLFWAVTATLFLLGFIQRKR